MGLMTAEEQFFFDLKGFILFPAVLEDGQIATIREQTRRLREAPESLPPAQRQLPGGAAAALIDHATVMRVLHTVIGKTEKMRLENCFLAHRERGDGKWNPHAGGRTVNPNYSYQYHNGKIYSGMTRVVWELNEVVEGRGGTMFMPGSHKANLEIPDAYDDPASGVWETYSCPPGSVLIFSEAVRHSTHPWTHADHARCALFFCYNHINVRHHKPGFTEEMVESLTPEHQRFFRDVYHPQFDNDEWKKRIADNAEKYALKAN